MAYETKELSGALFRNENKEHDKQPDWTGNIKINGKLWRLAAWETESRGGVDYLSIKISDPADFQRRNPPSDRNTQSKPRTVDDVRRGVPRHDHAADFDDDDIPF